MGEITSIVYKPQHVDFKPLDRFSRVPLEQARLVKDYGIEGDRKGGHPQRQLNILFSAHVEQLRAKGFKTAPGQLGEQIVLSGVDVAQIVPGTILQLGTLAQVKVVEWRNGCERFSRIHGLPYQEADGLLGVIATVVHGGKIRIGDAVKVLEVVG